ncbi:MAG: hypothetical protein IJY79_03285 [Clostridia bacterium]|nr:hypothetical protein [Clostridia bacterium]
MRKGILIFLVVIILISTVGCRTHDDINYSFSSKDDLSSVEFIDSSSQSEIIENDVAVNESQETIDVSSEEVITNNDNNSNNNSTVSSLPQASQTTETDNTPSYKPKLNYYYLPADASEIYKTSENLELYRDIVSAYLNYETTVPFDTRTQGPHYVLNMVRFHCPIFFADTYIDVDFADYNTDKLKITYTSKSKAEHNKIIEDFENACMPLIAGLSSETETERALVCYYRYVQTLNYDDALNDFDSSRFYLYAPDNPRYDEGYKAIVNKTGVCSSFSIAYSFLLSQLNIDSYTIFAAGKTDSHAWTMLKLNDKWYFADPTFDADWPQGENSISNFGVPAQQRILFGYNPENYFISNTSDNPFSYNVNDFRFIKLTQGAYSPEFNLETNTMIYKDTKGNIQQEFDLS